MLFVCIFIPQYCDSIFKIFVKKHVYFFYVIFFYASITTILAYLNGDSTYLWDIQKCEAQLDVWTAKCFWNYLIWSIVKYQGIWNFLILLAYFTFLKPSWVWVLLEADIAFSWRKVLRGMESLVPLETHWKNEVQFSGI